MQVKEAFVSVSRKKKNGRQVDLVNKLVVIRHHTRVSQHLEGRKPDNVSLSTFIG